MWNGACDHGTDFEYAPAENVKMAVSLVTENQIIILQVREGKLITVLLSK